MNIITLLALVLSFLNPDYEAKMQKRPKIVEAHRFHTESCVEDVLSVCVSEELIIVNPLLYQVMVTVNCGDSSDEADVLLYPRTKLTVDIELDLPMGTEPTCRIESWKRKL